jgi:hypothetical protein
MERWHKSDDPEEKRQNVVIIQNQPHNQQSEGIRR